MRSGEHKAEAERLLNLARTGEGKQADDPGDPVLVLQLAQTHALLAAVPEWDDVVDAEVVDDDADLLADATDLALTATLQARTLWSAAQWGNLMLIARDTREAILLSKAQLAGVRDLLARAREGATLALVKEARVQVEEWLKGFDA